MSKNSSTFICQSCGASSPKWAGRCDDCSAWNSFLEQANTSAPPKSLGAARGGKTSRIDLVPLLGSEPAPPRKLSHISEFDRVLGGGLVAGSSILLGGDPGIGKSTLLLQVVCKLSQTHKVAYISGEEAVQQVRLRADRLGLSSAPCLLASATSVRDIIASMESAPPDILIIDSIQTMFVDNIDSAPGTVSQVRSSAQELIRMSKLRNISLILVGHVTKDGSIAGPRVLEHMVDSVLYLEGDRGHQFRVLRAVKNRFGPTDEIGVFEMTDAGLSEVANPSALFLADRREDSTGAAVFAGLEGTRPVLVEIQALIAPCAYGSPRRALVGWDSARLAMVLAVLEARCGISFSSHDVYLNVAGGFRINEPAADLAVAAALLSAFSDVPVPAQSVVFGEIGLAGEIRRVSQPALRLKEAVKLGFSHAIMPSSDKNPTVPNMGFSAISHVNQLLPLFQASPKLRAVG